MAKYGGFNGGGMNMAQMMKQAQKMQEQMAKAQEELTEMEIEGESGGGIVTVTMNGKKKLTAIAIKPEAVDPDDIEMLEDLIIAAFNDAYEKADEKEKEMLPLAGIGF